MSLLGFEPLGLAPLGSSGAVTQIVVTINTPFEGLTNSITATVTTPSITAAINTPFEGLTNSITATIRGDTTLTAQDIIDVVDAIFGHIVESDETFESQLKLIRAEAAGKLAVVGNTVTLRDAADTKDRITATVDTNGQRTAITTDVI